MGNSSSAMPHLVSLAKWIEKTPTCVTEDTNAFVSSNIQKRCPPLLLTDMFANFEYTNLNLSPPNFESTRTIVRWLVAKNLTTAIKCGEWCFSYDRALYTFHHFSSNSYLAIFQASSSNFFQQSSNHGKQQLVLSLTEESGLKGLQTRGEQSMQFKLAPTSLMLCPFSMARSSRRMLAPTSLMLCPSSMARSLRQIRGSYVYIVSSPARGLCRALHAP